MIDLFVNTIIVFGIFCILSIKKLICRENTIKDKVLFIFCILYSSVMISILIIPNYNLFPFYIVLPDNNHFEYQNLIPFKTITEQLKNIIDGTEAFYNIKNCVGNVAIFVPLPICIKITNKKIKIQYCLFIAIGFSIIVECIQSRIGRIADIDDVVLNSIGAIIGTIFYILVKKSQFLIKKFKPNTSL